MVRSEQNGAMLLNCSQLEENRDRRSVVAMIKGEEVGCRKLLAARSSYLISVLTWLSNDDASVLIPPLVQFRNRLRN